MKGLHSMAIFASTKKINTDPDPWSFSLMVGNVYDPRPEYETVNMKANPILVEYRTAVEKGAGELWLESYAQRSTTNLVSNKWTLEQVEQAKRVFTRLARVNR